MGTHWGRNSAPGGIGGHCMAPAGTSAARVIAGERAIGPGNKKRPQQDSNLRSRLRRALIARAMTSGNMQDSRAAGCTWGAGWGRRARPRLISYVGGVGTPAATPLVGLGEFGL
jgi:hypothetical protein